MSDEVKSEGGAAVVETAKSLFSAPYKTIAIAAVAVMGGAMVGAMATNASAGSPADLSEGDLREIASTILNGAHVSHVQCGVGPNLCEVLAGDTLLYMDPTGRFGIAGNLLDFETRTDLTAQREQELVRFAAIAAGRDPAEVARPAPSAAPSAAPSNPTAQAPSVQSRNVEVTLPLENAVVYNGGQGLPVLNVFSDLNCSFCNRLHQEIDALGQYEVREYFIEWLGPSSREKALLVLCAEDRVEAATEMYRSGGAAITRSLAECEAEFGSVIAANTEFARGFGLQGTPAMFFEDGRAIGRGYAPAGQIVAEISAQ